MGRKVPTAKAEQWITEDGLLLITGWRRENATYAEIAERIGIDRATFYKWRERYPELEEALQTTRDIVNYKVENALLKRALGFQSKEIKVTLGKKVVGGKMFQVLKETTTKDVAPDVTACLAWLNNNNFDKWKRNRDKVVEVTDEDKNVNITIIRGKDSDNALGSETNTGVSFDINSGTGGKGKEKSGRDPELDVWPDDFVEDEEE